MEYSGTIDGHAHSIGVGWLIGGILFGPRRAIGGLPDLQMVSVAVHQGIQGCARGSNDLQDTVGESSAVVGCVINLGGGSSGYPCLKSIGRCTGSGVKLNIVVG